MALTFAWQALYPSSHVPITHSHFLSDNKVLLNIYKLEDYVKVLFPLNFSQLPSSETFLGSGFHVSSIFIFFTHVVPTWALNQQSSLLISLLIGQPLVFDICGLCHNKAQMEFSHVQRSGMVLVCLPCLFERREFTYPFSRCCVLFPLTSS